MVAMAKTQADNQSYIKGREKLVVASLILVTQ